MTEIEPCTGRDLQVSSHTKRYMERGTTTSTRKAYTYELARYTKWCAKNTRAPIPATPQTLTDYVGTLSLAGLAPSSIRRAMSAIATAHKLAGHAPPDTTGAIFALRGYRREEAEKGRRTSKAPALLLKDLRALTEACDPSTAKGVRDRALIILGWAMMGRRSEVTSLDIADVTETEFGIDVLVRMSKTDQDAEGAIVAIPYGEHPATCPVLLIRAWLAVLAATGETSGPLFRPIDRHGHLGGSPEFAGRSKTARMTPQAVEVVMTKAARTAGLGAKGYRPHSLRAGGATQAYLSGADTLATSRHGRWADNSTAFLGYIRDAERKRNNPMKGIGL